MSVQQHTPLHPGEFIKRVYLEPFNLGSNELARKLQVSKGTTSRLLNSQSRLSAESWMLMQDNFDLWQTRQSMELAKYEKIKFKEID